MTIVTSLLRSVQAGWPHRATPRLPAPAAGRAITASAPSAPLEAVALLRWAPDLAGVAIVAGGCGQSDCQGNVVLAGPELLLAAAIRAKLAHQSRATHPEPVEG